MNNLVIQLLIELNSLMISADVKEIVAKKFIISNLTRREILILCTSHINFYNEMPVELQEDQDIIYASLSSTFISDEILDKIMNNIDYFNIDVIHQLADSLCTFSCEYIRERLLPHIDDANYNELPYHWRSESKIRNFIFNKTSKIIKKEILFAEQYHKPFKVKDVFAFIDIGKFTVKPCAYDIFIKIE